ncbi:hypothetical protein EGR_11204 [Echinococcus granulosus]|uniref:Uncharacterized protein n=1 Tax=Echinococcus granulosus TaxID=6210 RepID=W6UKD2_ECHGR|nr:hypothetical protein EGR_11204 [Echinococcus granulosus]EUB53939.1 hypothetical protein EGR_11204 [Echinococcus granulosus]
MLLVDIELALLRNATAAIEVGRVVAAHAPVSSKVSQCVRARLLFFRVFKKAIILSLNNLQARHNYCVTPVVGTCDLEVGERCLPVYLYSKGIPENRFSDSIEISLFFQSLLAA